MTRKKTDNKTGMLQGLEVEEQGWPVPKDRVPSATVRCNSEFAGTEALCVKLKYLLAVYTLGWGTLRELCSRKRKIWVKAKLEKDGILRLSATRDRSQGACLTPYNSGSGDKSKIYFTCRLVEKAFPFLVRRGKHGIQVERASVIDTGNGKHLLIKFGISEPVPGALVGKSYPQKSGHRCSVTRKSNGRCVKAVTKQTTAPVIAPKPVPVPKPKPAAAVAPPEQRTPPVSSWPESNIATPAISTIPYAYGSLETRLGIVENQCLANEDNCNALEADLKALKETVAALKGSDVKTGKPETGFNETQKRQLGGIVKTVVIAQRRQSLEAEIERLKRVPEARTVTNPVAVAFFDQLKAKKAAGQERKDA